MKKKVIIWGQDLPLFLLTMLRKNLPITYPSGLQPACLKNSFNTQYLTIWSGPLTFFPLDCQIKIRQQSMQQQPSSVTESKLYLFFVGLAKNTFWCATVYVCHEMKKDENR